MKQELFSIYDSKAEHYLPPFVSFNEATARRQFQTTVNTNGHEFSNNPADFSLWHIGEYDTETSYITQADKIPRILCHGHDLVERAEPQLGLVQGGE